MQAARNVLNYFRHLSGSKVLVGGLFALALAVSGGILLSLSSSAEAAACRSNDIIDCGVANKDDFLAKFNQNSSGDLPGVYASYLAGFNAQTVASSAVEGTSHKDGTIRVNGKVVATGARSIGRNPQSGSTAISLNGKTYHESSNATVFQSDALPTLVVMKGEQFLYAIIKGCGNPEKGNPTGHPPSGTCDMLEHKKISRNEFQFNAKASVAGGGKIVKYIFTTDDGQMKEVASSATTASANFSFASEGKHVVKLSVVVDLGGELKTVTAPACETEVEVEAAPVFECVQLAASIITQGERKYRFTLTYRAAGGASLQTVDFDFGDGQSQKGVQPSSETTVTAEHEYAKKGEYTTVATLHFNINNKVQDKKCQVKLTVPEKPCEDNPNTPECNPCPSNPSLPKDSPACSTPPTSLPATGTAELIGGSLGLGSLTAAGYYFRSSRRHLIRSILKK